MDIQFLKLLHPGGRLGLKAWKLWDTCYDFRRNGKRVFLTHNEQVRKEAEGRLLELRVNEGW
jgi:hypothetical protein